MSHPCRSPSPRGIGESFPLVGLAVCAHVRSISGAGEHADGTPYRVKITDMGGADKRSSLTLGENHEPQRHRAIALSGEAPTFVAPAARRPRVPIRSRCPH